MDNFIPTKEAIQLTLAPLDLNAEANERLADELYYLAGHYRSSYFHKLIGAGPVAARGHFERLEGAAAKLQTLAGEMSDAMMRNFNAVRLKLHGKRRHGPFIAWEELTKELADIRAAAGIVAKEIPIQRRGNNPKVLQGRWLRHAVEAIELAIDREIETKAHDSAGTNYRLVGPAGAAFREYARTVQPRLALKTLVTAVRDYHSFGLQGPSS